MACKCCQKIVSDSDRILCRGFCGEVFHTICVKVDFPLMDQLRSHKDNVYWMCDDCSTLFANGHFRSTVGRYEKDDKGFPDAIKSIQDDITKLSTTVASLVAKVDLGPQTPTVNSGSWFKFDNRAQSSSAKRRRGNDGSSVVSKVQTKQYCGTKTTCSSLRTVETGNDLLWIHLSAFHPETTVQETVSFVRECLNMGDDQPVKVIKLIPKGRDPSTLNFVSFKVGIGKHLRTEALSCESWPQNILFREFEDRSKNVSIIVKIPSSQDPNSQPTPMDGTSGTDAAPPLTAT